MLTVQKRIYDIKERLLQAKNLLRIKRAEIVQVYIRRRQNEELLLILQDMYVGALTAAISCAKYRKKLRV